MLMNLNSQTRYNTAIYCRLSKDDGTSDESQSIISQRETLRNYAIKNDLSIIDYYIDDGYSGTQFDNRPEFQRMLSDIESNLINCIIVKDLSRLGRNYLQTGYYTEEYFPSKNVRFIAVNDAHDSLQENDFLPFKNIINEWYAKDISKKIKSVFRHRQKEGTLVINSPYGYRSDKEKGRVVDTNAAPIIKHIFTSFINHKSIKEIGEDLTNKKILTPKAYKAYFEGVNNDMPEGYDIKSTYKWTKACLYRILNDYQYTGALICDKSRTVSFKSKKEKRLNKEEWIVHEDKFEPIITKEEFNAVKNKLKNIARPRLSLDINKYNGLIFCKDCGKKLTFIRTEIYPDGLYTCKVKKCGTKRFPIKDVDRLIHNELLDFKDKVLKNEMKILNYLDLNKEEKFIERKEQNLKKLYEEHSNLLNAQSEAFEAKINKEISQEIYDNVSKELNSKLKDVKSKIEIINSEKFNNNSFAATRTFIDNIKFFNKKTTLTRNMLFTFIKRIEYTFVYNNSKKDDYEIVIDIYYAGIDWLVKENENLFN